MSILARLASLVNMGLFRDKLRTILVLNEFPGLFDHVVIDADRVCTHVGNETDVAVFANIEAFIELLRQHHGLLGAEI